MQGFFKKSVHGENYNAIPSTNSKLICFDFRRKERPRSRGFFNFLESCERTRFPLFLAFSRLHHILSLLRLGLLHHILPFFRLVFLRFLFFSLLFLLFFFFLLLLLFPDRMSQNVSVVRGSREGKSGVTWGKLGAT